MRLLFLLYLLCSMTIAVAQTKATDVLRNTVSWKTRKTVITEDSTVVNIDCVFKTRASRSISLQLGSITHHFDIHAIDGSWSDINRDGGILLYINADKTETVEIRRADDTITFIIDLSRSGGVTSNFVIDSFAIN